MSRARGHNLRNGLVWRDGRPRWEPSPASRRLGLKGRDLKGLDGAWLERGAAVQAADARALWAGAIRKAAAGGERARQDLATVLGRLGVPQDAAAAERRELVGDLISAARVVLGHVADAKSPLSRGERTVAALVAAYFASDALEVTASTLKAYRTQSKKLVAAFGERHVTNLAGRELAAWRKELLAGGLGLASANQAIGATGAFYAWGVSEGWLASSPAVRLKLTAAPGRLVMWEAVQETAFVTWCDANGFVDVADAVVALLWTGVRPIDLCAANLSDLAGETWRLTPQKTRRRGLEALPAIMPQVRARLARRAAQLVSAIDGAFLINPTLGKRHTPSSLRARFDAARAAMVDQGAAPGGLEGLRLQDCRDTCVTRLWEAGVAPERLWTWTGHSKTSVERILRRHYLVLRERGSLDMAEQLAVWARREGLGL